MCVQWTCINSLPVIMLLIVSLLGFDADDCSDFDSGSSQQHTCERQSDESQPAVVERYIYWAQIIPCTICWLFAAYSYHRFPIHGERLQQLEALQASSFKKVVLEMDAASTCGGEVQVDKSTDLDAPVENKSKAMVSPTNPNEDHVVVPPQ